MDKHCFSLVRNVFCSSEALYIASLSFVIFILLLAFFETWDCCYESDLILVSGVASKSVFFFFFFFFATKQVIFVCGPLIMKLLEADLGLLQLPKRSVL